ncbi:AAA family ATPase [Arcicella aquatica]|uniref:AAA family ATPase n=1 Tax=Arcicella aquatica TaxID=217141 RepID=A0ABU5QPP4_9BACT|nr:AAA family ATPase [Arcicella aquatica]MEA5258745.1 AAA family ATPase [Arcicella aquatica]
MLPIALKSFHIKNYRGIIDTQIDNIPDDTQWIFLTGENGFGKTSVLQALALGFTQKIDLEEEQENEATVLFSFKKNNEIIPEFSQEDINDENYFDYYSEMYGGIVMGLIDYTIGYGSTRLRISAGTSTEVTKKYDSTSSLFSNDTLLINIEERFKDWSINYAEGKAKLAKIFRELLPRLGTIQVSFDDKIKTTIVKYFEKDEEGNQYPEGLTFDQLAAGYRNIIGMIGDMIFRLSLEQDVEDYKDLEGIVLIDEFELHLHPKYQKLFVEKLTELFPKIQFIVSTHSPIPLLGAPKNSVIINVSRSKEEGIKAELLDIDFSVLTPNTILSSPIFGFQDLIPESKSNDEIVRTEDTYKEVLFHDQLDKQIDDFLTEENKQELLDLLKVK